jgi:hypothetical protein
MVLPIRSAVVPASPATRSETRPPVGHAGQHVPAVDVCTEDVAIGEWRFELIEQIACVVVVAGHIPRDQVGAKHEGDDEDGDHERRQRDPVPPEPAPRPR